YSVANHACSNCRFDSFFSTTSSQLMKDHSLSMCGGFSVYGRSSSSRPCLTRAARASVQKKNAHDAEEIIQKTATLTRFVRGAKRNNTVRTIGTNEIRAKVVSIE